MGPPALSQYFNCPTVLRAASIWGYDWTEHWDHGLGASKSQEASQIGMVVGKRLKLVCSLLFLLQEFFSPLELSEVFRDYTCTLHTGLTTQTKHFYSTTHIFRSAHILVKLTVWCSPQKQKFRAHILTCIEDRPDVLEGCDSEPCVANAKEVSESTSQPQSTWSLLSSWAGGSKPIQVRSAPKVHAGVTPAI